MRTYISKQGTQKMILENQARKEIQGEHERKKTQEEKTINNLILKYEKLKEQTGYVTIQDFYNKCLDDFEETFVNNLSEDEYNDAIIDYKKSLDMFKTRMSAIEMSQPSSSAVEIPNIKDIKFTRFELSIMSVEK